jgi:protein-disulfide isomerase
MDKDKLIQSISISIIIGAVLISGAIIYSSSQKSGNPTTVVNNPSPQPTAPSVDISKVKTAGEPFIGNPNAPVTVAYWFDYQCPFCKQNEQTVMPQLKADYIDTGKVKLVYKDYEFLGPDSQTLGATARAVWDVAPGKFYQWHKAIFDNSGTENSGWATKAKILSITVSVLGASDANKVMQLAITNASKYQAVMDADKAEGTAFGINGTPGTIIGKQLIVGAQPYSAFKSAVDQTLAGK